MGIVDFGVMCVDYVGGDFVRWLGSLCIFDFDFWKLVIDYYYEFFC